MPVICPKLEERCVNYTCNIIYQTSATTAKTSFNGTGISVFQHFDDTEQKDLAEPAITIEGGTDDTSPCSNSSSKTLPKLPISYTQVPPVTQNMSSAVPQIDGPVKSRLPFCNSCLGIALQVNNTQLNCTTE